MVAASRRFHPILKMAIRRAERDGRLTPIQRENIAAFYGARGRVGSEMRAMLERDVRLKAIKCGELPAAAKPEAIDWGKIIKWLTANLPAILQMLAAIVALFVL